MNVFDEAKQKLQERYEFWKKHTELDEKSGYHVSKERKEALELMKFTLDVLGDLQAEAQKTWRELLDDFPQTKVGDGFLSYKKRAEKWKEKAEKLLENSK